MGTGIGKQARNIQTAAAGPEPRNFWHTAMTLTPVVLTVLATILAGLSSGEMTRAQYYRAMAAENQSKAGDQWGNYQAKRGRAAGCGNANDLLAATRHSLLWALASAAGLAAMGLGAYVHLFG